MKTKLFFIMTLSSVLFITGCDVLDQVSRVATLSKCEFRLASVQQITLAGVNVQQVHRFTDLSFADGARLTAALASGQFPLEFTLNVEARNPNPSAAGLTRMNWTLFIDDIEMTKGILQNPVSIPANNGTAVIPLRMNVDLKKVLTGKSADAILNFGLNLAGAGNQPTRIKMHLQPVIQVNNRPITYPGYITVGTEFGSS